MISALYVIKGGCYDIPGFDLWDIERDARKYKGPNKVICHPPCERWGRYWGGGPMLHGTEKQKFLGDDEQCFSHSVWATRTFGGVIEHPEGSHAFRYYGLPIPDRNGGWTQPDRWGGRSCCVAQGHYGHRAQKLTWLYGVKVKYLELKWGKAEGKTLIDEGFHSKEERARAIKTGICQRLSRNQRMQTPIEFRDLLLEMVK